MERFKKWFENYWYHYKWQTLIALVFIVTFAIGFGQIVAEKNSYDVYALYGGAKYLEKAPHDEIVNILTDAAEKVGGSELSKDDEKDVNLQMLIYLTDEQIAAQKAEVEAAGEIYTFDYLENNNVFQTFMKQLVSGENVIMFLDPSMYATAEENEALYKVQDILGRKVPGLNESGTGIVLGESGLVEKYPAFAAIPQESIVCFRQVTHAMKLIGKSESKETHTFQLDVARELFSGIGQ